MSKANTYSCILYFTAIVNARHVPSMFISDSRWRVLTSGAVQCLSHSVATENRIDTYCLNEPEGRYLTLRSGHSVGNNLIGKILNRSWRLELFSRKGLHVWQSILSKSDSQ